MGINWSGNSEFENEQVRPLTRDELDEFMKHVKDAASLGEQIYKNFIKILDERAHIEHQKHTQSELINDLNARIKFLTRENKKFAEENEYLQQQSQGTREVVEKQAESISTLHETKEENRGLKQLVKQLKRQLQEKDEAYVKVQEDLKKLKRIIDPLKEMDRKSQVISPGDITHDDVASRFTAVYGERRILQPLKISDSNDRHCFLTSLFESAYEACADHILDVCLNELKKLHLAPTERLTAESSEEEFSIMRSRLDAYSCLVSISGAKNQPVPHSLVEKIMEKSIFEKILTSENREYTVKIVYRVVENCWDMVKITPPMTLGLQPSCDEDYFERKFPRDQQDLEFEEYLKLPNKKLQLLRPTLFYTPHGTYSKKGLVGIVEMKANDSCSGEPVPVISARIALQTSRLQDSEEVEKANFKGKRKKNKLDGNSQDKQKEFPIPPPPTSDTTSVELKTMNNCEKSLRSDQPHSNEHDELERSTCLNTTEVPPSNLNLSAESTVTTTSSVDAKQHNNKPLNVNQGEESKAKSLQELPSAKLKPSEKGAVKQTPQPDLETMKGNSNECFQTVQVPSKDRKGKDLSSEKNVKDTAIQQASDSCGYKATVHDGHLKEDDHQHSDSSKHRITHGKHNSNATKASAKQNNSERRHSQNSARTQQSKSQKSGKQMKPELVNTSKHPSVAVVTQPVSGRQLELGKKQKPAVKEPPAITSSSENLQHSPTEDEAEKKVPDGIFLNRDYPTIQFEDSAD